MRLRSRLCSYYANGHSGAASRLIRGARRGCGVPKFCHRRPQSPPARAGTRNVNIRGTKAGAPQERLTTEMTSLFCLAQSVSEELGFNPCRPIVICPPLGTGLGARTHGARRSSKRAGRMPDAAALLNVSQQTLYRWLTQTTTFSDIPLAAAGRAPSRGPVISEQDAAALRRAAATWSPRASIATIARWSPRPQSRNGRASIKGHAGDGHEKGGRVGPRGANKTTSIRSRPMHPHERVSPCRRDVARTVKVPPHVHEHRT